MIRKWMVAAGLAVIVAFGAGCDRGDADEDDATPMPPRAPAGAAAEFESVTGKGVVGTVAGRHFKGVGLHYRRSRPRIGPGAGARADKSRHIFRLLSRIRG